MTFYDLEEQRQKIEEATRRGMAFLNAGSNVSNVEILKRILATLDGILLKADATDADKIAAADTLYRIMFGPDFPAELVEVKP